MPLILQDKKDKFSLAVWQINEDLSFFLDKIELYPTEKAETKYLKGKRLLEWIASRYLLSLLENNKRSCCLKDKYGKPYLENSRKKISLSHSGNYIAVCISNQNIGIDIQTVSDKINRIKNKFLSEVELEICNDELLCLNRFWTAKEAVYKAYGQKGLNFIDNIVVDAFVEDKDLLISTGKILKDNNVINFQLFSDDIGKSIMTVAIEK